MSQDAYTVHHPARKNYPRYIVITNGIDDLWQMDLVDSSYLSKINDENKFLITCNDVFSKFFWAIPLKSKSADAVLIGFKIIKEYQISYKMMLELNLLIKM